MILHLVLFSLCAFLGAVFVLRVLFMCICCTLRVLVVLVVFVVILCVFFVSYVYLLYFLCVFVVPYVCLLYYVCIVVLTLDAGLLARSQSCDRPSRHRFFLVSLCLQANAEMVPKFPSCYYMPLM